MHFLLRFPTDGNADVDNDSRGYVFSVFSDDDNKDNDDDADDGDVGDNIG